MGNKSKNTEEKLLARIVYTCRRRLHSVSVFTLHCVELYQFLHLLSVEIEEVVIL